jgi:hypothetical protein
VYLISNVLIIFCTASILPIFIYLIKYHIFIPKCATTGIKKDTFFEFSFLESVLSLQKFFNVSFISLFLIVMYSTLDYLQSKISILLISYSKISGTSF